MKEIISTSHAPAAVGPYSQATKVGSLVFTAGQIALDPKTGEMVTDSFKNEVTRVLENLRAVLEAADTSMENVLKVTVYVTDLANFGELNEIYGEYFSRSKPARSTVQVAALPKGARVEMDAIAAV
jgi:2-iminobutanoate/2-iminopropanoate deaminase